MEKIQVKPQRDLYALSDELVEDLIKETDGKVFSNKKEVFLYLLRYVFESRYEETHFKDTDQLFTITYDLKDRRKSQIQIKGVSILFHINLTAIFNCKIISLPINLEKEINLLRTTYTVNNESGRTFVNLFNRFDPLNKILKCRFIDKFEYPSSVEHISHLRFELLVIICTFLDFKSLYNILTSCNEFHRNFWKANEDFWYNLYTIRFSRPPFKPKMGNWAKIYKSKLPR